MSKMLVCEFAYKVKNIQLASIRFLLYSEVWIVVFTFVSSSCDRASSIHRLLGGRRVSALLLSIPQRDVTRATKLSEDSLYHLCYACLLHYCIVNWVGRLPDMMSSQFSDF